MQLTDNKFIFPRHNLLSDYTNCPEQLIRFILKTSSPLSKIILIFPESEKYFLCYSTFIYLFFFCNHSNCPMSSINHPKNGGQKTVFFCSFFAPKLSSNHYMLWSILIISYPNHNTSSELYSPRALSSQKRCRTPLVPSWRQSIFPNHKLLQTFFARLITTNCFTTQVNCKQKTFKDFKKYYI